MTTNDPHMPAGASTPVCPGCGSTLPADAPEGLCPRCLAAVNFGDATLFTGDVEGALPPPPVEEIAPHFPQLEILACLGRGGMGVVYKARQVSLDRLVALKLLAPEREKDPEFSERFAREAQALARMSHPHIVTVHDFGQAGGFFYLLMEYVDGANLRQLLQSHRFTPEQALGMVPPLCDALQYAHDRGIVHRDIKPENLLMDREGKLKVADFGLAKMLESDVTGDERAMGTPGYMAPEQSGDPAKVDNRADIYSLGVVIYEMLTGELPEKNFVPPSRKAGVDSRLDEVVSRAMEQEPSQRYQQASILKTEVENISREIPPVPPPLPPGEDPGKLRDMAGGGAGPWPGTPSAVPSAMRAYPPPHEADHAKLRESVNSPAVAMMFTSGLAVVTAGFSMLAALGIFWESLFLSRQVWPLRGLLPSHLATLPVGLFFVLELGFAAAGVVAFIGANRMRLFQSYSWARASAFLLIACGFLSLPGLSVSVSGLVVMAQIGTGIWGLVVLNRGNVKPLFGIAAGTEGRASRIPGDMARRFAIPAWGLIATAGINFLCLAILCLFCFAAMSRGAPSWAFLLCLFAMLPAVLIFLGGWNMKQGEGNTLAIVGAVLAIITPPGFLIGVIFGIWALVVLLDRGGEPGGATGVPGIAGSEVAKTGSGKGWVIAGITVLVVVMASLLALPVGYLLIRRSIVKTRPVPVSMQVPEFGMPVPTMGGDNWEPSPVSRASANPGADGVAGGPDPEEDLQARYQASQMIREMTAKSRALSSVAKDAAVAGNFPLVRQAIAGISDIQLRDEASHSAAYTLSDHGMRGEAVQLASAMGDISLRDKALAGLAARGLPGGPDTEEGLRARQKAAQLVQDLSAKGKAFSVLARDAAALGNLQLARQAIFGISDLQMRDETSEAVAYAASDRGMRREAVQVASQISGLDLRDKTLTELSTRKAPAAGETGAPGETSD